MFDTSKNRALVNAFLCNDPLSHPKPALFGFSISKVSILSSA